jgi:hypothetical protein
MRDQLVVFVMYVTVILGGLAFFLTVGLAHR